MAELPVRYRSSDEDSGRWAALRFRPDDIVITTRSKSGTTWMQMLCALLIFGRPELPRPLHELSPWLDWLVDPLEEVLASLEAQTHRRFIKTHTPLDGIPIRDDVSYITVARHPLDMALSLHHHSLNIDRERLRHLTATAAEGSATEQAGSPAGPTTARQPKRQPDRRPEQQPNQRRPDPARWMRAWIAWRGEPAERLDSLPGVMHHLSLAWAERDRPNMILVHFDDLLAELPREMARLAEALGITIADDDLPALAAAAGFARMKASSTMVVPDGRGVLKSSSAFFRAGRSGTGAEILEPADLDAYHRRAAELAAPDLLAWLHRDH